MHKELDLDTSAEAYPRISLSDGGGSSSWGTQGCDRAIWAVWAYSHEVAVMKQT